VHSGVTLARAQFLAMSAFALRSSARAARMAFPPRMTADGVRISSLPREEAERALARARGASTSSSVLESVLRPKRTVRALGPDRVPEGAPRRRTLREDEMQSVDLGGADP